MSTGTLSRSSWQVKDAEVLKELLQLVQLTDEESGALAVLKDQAIAAETEMTREFYERLGSHANTREYLEGIDLDGLKRSTGTWFTELFNGVYDEAYAKRRIVVGQVHVRIGLPVRYPLAMLDVIAAHGELITRAAADPELATRAFRKVLAFDVAVFNQAYEDNQLHHLSELVGGERLARLLLSGG